LRAIDSNRPLTSSPSSSAALVAAAAAADGIAKPLPSGMGADNDDSDAAAFFFCLARFSADFDLPSPFY
jgi:hypothetical protein